jgi:hypothetical protein
VGEHVQDYRAMLDCWMESLRPQSLAEARLVAQVADVAFRQDRLVRLEERLVAPEVEKHLALSEPMKKRRAVERALEGIRGLTVLAESVASAIDGGEVAKLMPAMRSVAKLVAAADDPVAPAAALDRALDALVTDTVGDVEPAAFATLTTSCRQVETALVAQMTEAEQAVEAERERLVELVVLGEHEHAKLLDRHRARLQRELRVHLDALKVLRDLASPQGDTHVAPLVVDVRVVGRGEFNAGA